MAKQRSEISASDKWNVEAIYPSVNDWEIAFQKSAGQSQRPRWPQITSIRGTLSQGPEAIKKALDLISGLDRELAKLFVYAKSNHDVEITEEKNKTLYGKIFSLLSDFQEEIAWFEPELLSLSDNMIKTALASPILAEYKFHLEKILRIKPHVLSAEQEELLALSSQALQTANKTFSSINDADFKFGKAIDKEGKEHELTHGSYALAIRSQDRVLRKDAFKKYHGVFQSYENTLCELLHGQMHAHYFQARAHKYASCVDAALFPKNIDVEVYHSLVKAVGEGLDALHEYVELRRYLPNIDQLHLYDMYVPIASLPERNIPYSEGENLVIESVAALGSEYQNILQRGLQKEGWVDRYENQHKRSGAYSSGCYDTMPYILMNYKGLLRDVFTLAHEAGHSMHSYLTHKSQPYIYGDYPIFLAEVASTFNEELLMRLMIDRAANKEEKIYLITQKLEDLRGTLFRQTMFAEFELKIHQFVEQSIPLTPQLLKEEYKKLNQKYFGPKVVIDPEALAEWARIPHFYYNFYVYQYATGISAAQALVERVTKGGKAERDAYLTFLKSGCSRYPIETLKAAGVDMRTPEPVKATIEIFRQYVKVLAGLLK